MVLLAVHPETGISTRRIARKLQVSEAHLSKVLQRLTKVGVATSTRGPGGGFTLARPAEDITLLELYEAIEGPLVATHCLMRTRICNGKRCIFGDLLRTVDGQVRQYLAGTRLAELTGVYEPETERAERVDDDA
jgi:Rrf2 family protein